MCKSSLSLFWWLIPISLVSGLNNLGYTVGSLKRWRECFEERKTECALRSGRVRSSVSLCTSSDRLPPDLVAFSGSCFLLTLLRHVGYTPASVLRLFLSLAPVYDFPVVGV